MGRTQERGQAGVPLGRRPGESDTRRELLNSARRVFAEKGYDGAGLREIAASAGVDPGMIRHHFGDKETLFVAAMTEDSDVTQRLADCIPGPTESIGRRVTDTYLRLWEDPDTKPVLAGLVRTAMTSQKGASLLSEFLAVRVQAPAELPMSGRARTRGLLLAASHLLGVAVAKNILQVPGLADVDHDELVRAISPAIQGYLTEDTLS